VHEYIHALVEFGELIVVVLDVETETVSLGKNEHCTVEKVQS
jgi:hypothetical protein